MCVWDIAPGGVHVEDHPSSSTRLSFCSWKGNGFIWQDPIPTSDSLISRAPYRRRLSSQVWPSPAWRILRMNSGYSTSGLPYWFTKSKTLWLSGRVRSRITWPRVGELPKSDVFSRIMRVESSDGDLGSIWGWKMSAWRMSNPMGLTGVMFLIGGESHKVHSSRIHVFSGWTGTKTMFRLQLKRPILNKYLPKLSFKIWKLFVEPGQVTPPQVTGRSTEFRFEASIFGKKKSDHFYYWKHQQIPFKSWRFLFLAFHVAWDFHSSPSNLRLLLKVGCFWTGRPRWSICFEQTSHLEYPRHHTRSPSSARSPTRPKIIGGGPLVS